MSHAAGRWKGQREERWWWWWWWWAKETVKKTPSVFTKENIVHERVPFLFCPLPTLHTLHFLRYIIPFVPSLSLCSIAVIIIIIAIIAIEIVIVILLLCHPPQSHSTQSRLSLATFPPASCWPRFQLVYTSVWLTWREISHWIRKHNLPIFFTLLCPPLFCAGVLALGHSWIILFRFSHCRYYIADVVVAVDGKAVWYVCCYCLCSPFNVVFFCLHHLSLPLAQPSNEKVHATSNCRVLLVWIRPTRQWAITNQW